jgi:hypothetical protein
MRDGILLFGKGHGAPGRNARARSGLDDSEAVTAVTSAVAGRDSPLRRAPIRCIPESAFARRRGLCGIAETVRISSRNEQESALKTDG